MITPTVGRVVWYHAPSSTPDAQPQAAIIAFVHSDCLVNLHVIDANGVASGATSVVLVQEGDTAPAAGFYCEWMPYQKGQAAKTEAVQAQLSASSVLDTAAGNASAVAYSGAPVSASVTLAPNTVGIRVTDLGVPGVGETGPQVGAPVEQLDSNGPHSIVDQAHKFAVDALAHLALVAHDAVAKLKV
jgi:hypothetical protein